MNADVSPSGVTIVLFLLQVIDLQARRNGTRCRRTNP